MRHVSMLCAVAGLVACGFASASTAQVRVTEVMSEGQGDIAQGNGGRRQREFFELTNLGAAPVDLTGWSYNDNNTNDPIAFGALVGILQPGQSAVFTQMTAADFRTYWGLDNSVVVFSFLQLSNLGNADTINIYNSEVQDASTLVESVSYTAAIKGISLNRPYDGTTNSAPNVTGTWATSFVGDSFGSFLAPSPTGFPPNFPTPGAPWVASDYIDLANPGSYIPTPGAFALMGLSGLLVARRRR